MAMRVYEFSKKYGVTNKEVLHVLRESGVHVSNHMALLSQDATQILEKHFSESKQGATSEGAGVDDGRGIYAREMTVAELASCVNKPVNTVILDLLKKGVVATKNQSVAQDVVADLAHHYGIAVLEETSEVVGKVEEIEKEDAASEKDQAERLPVVVVIGHVDHGKTTLLDYIRKTRVTAKEKGGITQHVGAYKAHTDHGDLVFIDTPGHEAFSIMRARGASMADIAILVVAADDGVMPQTIEAIKHAEAAGVPIIVAITKTDKATDAQIEKVYEGLARYSLLPEQWGGQTSAIAVSAIRGEGIDDLLEIVVLQSGLMELKANTSAPAAGYVLESVVEKGRGPVATVICKQGVLREGEFFAAGATHGRVSSLRDFQGNIIHEAYPSEPVRVAGFSDLAKPGDVFKVGSQRDIKKGLLDTAPASDAVHRPKEGAINIIVKADGVSSQEAVVDAIGKLSTSLDQSLHVLQAGVGMINESDITLASDTDALVYGLHTKVDSKAALLAQKLDVFVSVFNIIYRLLEDVEAVANSRKQKKTVTRKVGEAHVLKVFDIKKLGVIAGFRVSSGYIAHDGYLVVWRGKNRIGEGEVVSLQQDRKSVKEVKKGFEGALMIADFENWQEDDRIECYCDVAEA